MIPPRYRPAAAQFGRRCLPLLWRYIAGVMLVVAYASILTWIVAKLILNIPHAGLFAIAVGLLELIPVVGPILSAMLIGTMALSRGGVGEILGFAGFALGLRLSIDQLVGPIILGRAVSVPAPIIIFTMLVGGTLWGILGVLLAVPAAAMIRLALEMAYEEEPPESHPK
jgi:predicted PurR-regulated permease PerM